jgi:virulence factor Mce-like protein
MNATGRRGGINPLFAGFAAGVLIAFVVGLMATINLQYGAPWAKSHTLTAQVADADSMSVGSDVRIAGRLVGQVVSINAAGSYANITFHVDDVNWPLPSDTTAFVRLATLLGQKYVQLNPGHSSHWLADNATIGLQLTRPVVDFDQILNTFDKRTTDSLTGLIRTAAAAVQGQEGTLQQLIPNLSDLSVHSQVPTKELVTRDPELNKILINLGITADQLSASREDFAGVITHLNQVTAALSSSEGEALKSYITNTDTLNVTTHTVLANGNAQALDSGLQQIGQLAGYLNTLMTHLIPQTAAANTPCTAPQPQPSLTGCNGTTDGNVNVHGATTTPAQAGIDLIYEIGASAVSQGDGSAKNDGINVGNFFLRQYAQGIDVCGLLNSLKPAATPSQLACPNSSPAPPSPPPLPTLPPVPPLPPLPPLPCVPILNLCPHVSTTPTCLPTFNCAGDGLPSVPGAPAVPPIGGPNLPPAPCVAIVDPTCPSPTPTLPVGIAYHIDGRPNDARDVRHSWWQVRYR